MKTFICFALFAVALSAYVHGVEVTGDVSATVEGSVDPAPIVDPALDVVDDTLKTVWGLVEKLLSLVLGLVQGILKFVVSALQDPTHVNLAQVIEQINNVFGALQTIQI
ncbi:hypothetical protein ACFFRR_007111 [Megaselia abdita]